MIKFFFIKIIEFYWKIIPESNRNECIFSESCSKYVKRILEENGILEGTKALFFRFYHCRDKYKIREKQNEIYLYSRGVLFPEKKVNPQIIKLYTHVKKINHQTSPSSTVIHK